MKTADKISEFSRLTVALLLVSCVFTGCKSERPTQPAAARQIGWRPITTFKGQGSVQTESFNIESTQWRIKWETKDDPAQVPSPVAGSFQVIVHSAVSGRPMLEAVLQKGSGQGVAYVTEDPRLYHLVIESSGILWSLSVEEAVAQSNNPAR